jgi:uncharacterized SAM-binding protein YcdF (DUF218 family)
VPDDLKDITRPIIGYIGGIHHHIDFGLLKYIAKSNPRWSIVLVGPIQTSIEGLKNISNIYFIGKRDFSRLPEYIGQFDVCLVPYLLNEYTETVYPTKISEYLMMGKPVVSTALPEVIKFSKEGIIFIGNDYEDFTNKISLALERNSDEDRNLRVSFAQKNSWGKRIEEMSEKILKAIAEKEKIKEPLSWQERFLEIYRQNRKKMARFIISIALFIGIIFYTPVVWYLAEPLKFSQRPEISDAIVVFAGGVGESGQPGQGYEERVKKAVELYEQGFAKHIIFSSGAVSTFPEPYVMKALAVSLGVPEEAIILEDKASSAYENVKFTNRILDSNTWDKIILVTSPYNVRRVSLIFNGLAPEKEVTYLYSDSVFYQRVNINARGLRKFKQINLRQIRGIVH